MFTATEPGLSARQVSIVSNARFADWLDGQPADRRTELAGSQRLLERGLPVAIGDAHVVKASLDEPFWVGAALADALPAGDYAVSLEEGSIVPDALALGWAHALNKTPSGQGPHLVVPADTCARLETVAAGLALSRRLVDMPPNRLTPAIFAAEAAELGQSRGAVLAELAGDELARRHPLLNAVGRASEHPPRHVELAWAHERPALSVAIIGKGVTFDTGGLHLKTPAGMAIMKKDMAGAAQALALFSILVDLELPLDLRVMLPLAENATDARAVRPGDVLTSAAGFTVEIDDPDAEGRLILADSLHHADAARPDLIIDIATLTGAQRMACGFELPSYFSNDEHWSQTLEAAAREAFDPVWRLPLHQPYRRMLKSRVADFSNCGMRPQGEAIFAALFMESFLANRTPWLHFDLMGWNTEARPGRPVGAEPQAVRALIAMLEKAVARPDQFKTQEMTCP